MNIERSKIRISIKDLRKYREVAYFLDKPSFVEDISRVRDFLHISQLVNYDSVITWVLNQPKIGFDINSLSSIKRQVDTLMKIDREEAIIINNIRKGTRYITEFIRAFEFKYGKVGFGDIIKYAITSGVVTDDELQLETLTKEIKKFGGRKIIDNLPDTAGEIARDRDWYWRNLARDSYEKISKREGYTDSSSSVKQAIIAYKKMLR